MDRAQGRANEGRGVISLPADVAADDDVAAEDGTLGHVLVDGVGDLGSKSGFQTL